MLDLKKLEAQLDAALNKETSESLRLWFAEREAEYGWRTGKPEKERDASYVCQPLHGPIQGRKV
jgi:hypothetical protein